MVENMKDMWNEMKINEPEGSTCTRRYDVTLIMIIEYACARTNREILRERKRRNEKK